jgi:hypothetical protein
VSLALADVPVDSRAFRQARTRYDAVAGTFAERQAQRVEIDRSLTELSGQDARVHADLVAARARRAAIASRLDDVNGAIADLGVALYLSGGGAARIDAALTADQPSINDLDRREVLGDASLDVLLGERAAYQARLDETEARIDEAASLLEEIRARRADLRAERPRASEAELAAAPPVATERVAYETARVLATVEGVEFPLVALDTYYRAARSSAEEDPACGVRWWAIAGISRVEGHHGTYGGAALDERGDATKRIIGIQLNGTTRPMTGRSGRCSSSRRPGAASPPTATRTAWPTRSTSTTRPSPPPATCAGPAAASTPSPGCAPPTSRTTTPRRTSIACCPSRASTSARSRSPNPSVERALTD